MTQVETAAAADRSVVLLTADDALVAEVQRLAAAAGVELVVHRAVVETARWPGQLLLVGADRARALARRGGGRRPDVIVVDLAPEHGSSALSGLPDSPGGRADAAWRHAVALGADQVAVLPMAREWLVQRLARTAEPPARARVLGVLGGCGGAGASLFAAALAVVGADRGHGTALVDLDPLGGGLDFALGLDDVPGLRWPDLAAARGRLPAGSLHGSLPQAGPLAVLAWGRGDPVDVSPSAIDCVLDAACRGHELVVIDLPRTLDATTECALQRVDELVLVVPARLRALVAACQLRHALGPYAHRATVVVRRGPSDRLSARRVSDALDLPVATVLRDDSRVGSDRGDLPGARRRSPLRRAAEQCLAASGAAADRSSPAEIVRRPAA
ncbi:septum site-determining protein Ssd [Angustibacter sp. McL0619]|uniref:septum site-determining protein Ssd n=1 Tax=Angustibacter sp. McL0619 TaxID=3415676 RepID=UPI003CFACDE1